MVGMIVNIAMFSLRLLSIKIKTNVIKENGLPFSFLAKTIFKVLIYEILKSNVSNKAA